MPKYPSKYLYPTKTYPYPSTKNFKYPYSSIRQNPSAETSGPYSTLTTHTQQWLSNAHSVGTEPSNLFSSRCNVQLGERNSISTSNLQNKLSYICWLVFSLSEPSKPGNMTRLFLPLCIGWKPSAWPNSLLGWGTYSALRLSSLLVVDCLHNVVWKAFLYLALIRL